MNRKSMMVVISLIIIIAEAGVWVNYRAEHYQGGEIYEAANHAYGLLVKGFNVTVNIETTNGSNITGELFSVRGSTIYVIHNGEVLSVGGPSATEEDVRAKLIQVSYHGKVYIYDLPPRLGKLNGIFKNLTVPAYSERFGGTIYIEGNVSPITLGMLKYTADYKSYGSLTINQIGSNGAIVTANKVPISFLEEYLGNYRVYLYGILYVNSDERNLPLKLLEVRTG